MQTQVIERARVKRPTGTTGVVAYTGAAAFAIGAAWFRDLLARDRALARIGALTIGAGTLLWITGSVVQLGGHRAVGLMATHTKRPGRRAFNLTDLMLIADGVVLLPVWLIWSGYIGGTGHGSTTAA